MDLNEKLFRKSAWIIAYAETGKVISRQELMKRQPPTSGVCAGILRKNENARETLAWTN
ncbi:MAG: hypothetical protein ACTHKB_02935 [Burkholderiaceae bacterium]